MENKKYVKVIIEFSNGTYYEVDGELLNKKQIELIAHILDIPEMLDCIRAE